MQDSNIVRLFISSTFSDFERERDALKEYVFPKLSELCNQYGMKFQPIDLRWGVSEKDTKTHRTMDICLEEIQSSQNLSPRPNFLLLMGDRYGWQPIPNKIPEDEFLQFEKVLPKNDFLLLNEWYLEDKNSVPITYILQDISDEENWIKAEKHLQHLLRSAVKMLNWNDNQHQVSKYFSSATEHEIIKGVLNIEDPASSVVCMMRTIESLPSLNDINVAKYYVDIDDSTGVIDNFAQQRLNGLKEAIYGKLSGNILHYAVEWTDQGITHDYLDQFCADVIDRLSQLILLRHEERTVLKDANYELIEHKIFAENHVKHYIGMDIILKDMENYFYSNLERPLIIWGKAGTGKTALLSKAAYELQSKDSYITIIQRYVGANPSSFQLDALLASICKEIQDRYAIQPNSLDDTPKDWIEWFERLRLYASQATKHKPLIIFLDALNKLESTTEAVSFIKRLNLLPSNVKMILSVSASMRKEIEESFTQECFLKMTEMSYHEAEVLLNRWLVDIGRTLTSLQRKAVLLTYSQNPSPLFLRFLFEYVNSWVSWTEEEIDFVSMDDVINGFLESLENKHGTTLTSRGLSYLILSRHGLSEQEWIELLSTDLKVIEECNKRHPSSKDVSSLPINIFSNFTFDLKPYLTEKRNGQIVLINFLYDYFYKVVEKRYLEDLTFKREVRAHLIELYEVERIQLERKVVEYPWQLSKQENWEKLHQFLMDETLFPIAWNRAQFDVMNYWFNVEQELSVSKKILCEKIMKNTEKYSDEFIESCSLLLKATNCIEESIYLFPIVIERMEKRGDILKRLTYLNHLGLVNFSIGKNDVAMAQFKEVEKFANVHGYIDKMVYAINNQGLVLREQNRSYEAYKKFKQVEEVSKNYGLLYPLAVSYNNQGLYYEWINQKKALELFEKAEEIAKDIGRLDTLLTYTGNIAQAFYVVNEDLNRAYKKFSEAIDYARQLGDKGNLTDYLYKQSIVSLAQGNIEHAIKCLNEVETYIKNDSKLRAEISEHSFLQVNSLLKNLIDKKEWKYALEIVRIWYKLHSKWKYHKGVKVFIKIEKMILQLKRKHENPNLNKIGRNDSCYCGSGIKYKKCHGN